MQTINHSAIVLQPRQPIFFWFTYHSQAGKRSNSQRLMPADCSDITDFRKIQS